MRWTVSRADVGLGGRTAGLVVAAVLAWAPAPASGQTPVVDSAANATLSSILAELQTQTAILNTHTDRLNEIKELQEGVLDAICGKSTIATRIASVEDLDLTNAGVTALGLMRGELPGDIQNPNPGDVQAIQRSAEEVFGLARRVVGIVDQGQRIVDQARSASQVETQLRRLTLNSLDVIRRMRENALLEAVEGSYAFATYSLNQGPAAQGREVSMNQARTSADCLREDVNASNQTMLEVLSRVNHLTTLMGYRTALDSATALRGIPILSDPLEDEGQ